MNNHQIKEWLQALRVLAYSEELLENIQTETEVDILYRERENEPTPEAMTND